MRPRLYWVRALLGLCLHKEVLHRRKAGVMGQGWCHAQQDREFPFSNVWLGVSVEDQKMADERIPLLLQTPAAVRWVSYEPALGPIDFQPWLTITRQRDRMLDWIVAGGESGPGARPAHPDWFRSVRDQCLAAGVPFFFKQWGEWDAQNQRTKRTTGSVFGNALHNWNKPGTDIPVDSDCRVSFRVGKKAAGRLLDGVEWSEFPMVSQ